MNQLRFAIWGVISLSVIGVFLITLFTTPIWATLLIINSPLIALGALLFFYTNLFNPLIKLYWKFVISSLTVLHPDNDLTMLNVGFAEVDEGEGLFLQADDVNNNFSNAFDRYRYQLYHYIVITLGGDLKSMEGKTLLETGCGRGGGLNYLSSILKPQYAIGVDFSRIQINFCKRNWPVRLNFIHGDSEKITQVVPRNSIDYLVDIESSFFYPNKESFLHEACMALKDDGTFFFGTLVPKGKQTQMNNWIERYFEVVKKEDITDNVVRSLKLDSRNVSSWIENNFPWFMTFFLKQSWAIDGTFLHRLIENKKLNYYAFVLKKKQRVTG